MATGPITLYDLEHLSRPGDGADLDDTFRPTFWAAIKGLGLEWPDEVLEQFLYRHGKDGRFLAEYGGLNLRSLGWSLEHYPASDLVAASTSRKIDDGRTEDAARDPIDFEQRYRSIDWKLFEGGTWAQPPVFLERQVLWPGRDGLHLVDGHTRLGALRGYVARGTVAPDSLHSIWLGKS